MTAATALTLLGFGLGALIVARSSGGGDPRAGATGASLRDRAIAAQRDAARAAKHARELAGRWSEEARR